MKASSTIRLKKGICCPNCKKEVISRWNKLFDLSFSATQICPHCFTRYSQPKLWSFTQIALLFLVGGAIGASISIPSDLTYRGMAVVVLFPFLAILCLTNLFAGCPVEFKQITSLDDPENQEKDNNNDS